MVCDYTDKAIQLLIKSIENAVYEMSFLNYRL
ncbi:hypothetical protein F960_01325 [Acinetobacter gerneri DSM 14967 = CIP 107464 = MTCC 9824]|uniref:Uncharacterized protein n=1 Tax=Acinetobacter gerneri DSM 14967 = CIP 107464 = MTCC 9824 TaxID=1120926 RepID=N8YDB2_9GAMM|nr:hypothetical protein F960_01325 [Acinetobacter gerneri DSM 14967 = CIP 107464 = MTCC 9824]